MRDQFLNERIEYYKELETAIANAAAADGTDMCTRDHVRAGLLHLDPDMADHTVSVLTELKWPYSASRPHADLKAAVE